MLVPLNSNEAPEKAQTEAEQFVQTALDALSAHTAILDGEGYILSVNAAWRIFADRNNFGDPKYGIGTNYLAVCDAATERSSRHASRVARGIRHVINHDTTDFEMEYPCHSPTERRWFVVRVSRFEWYGEMRLIIAHQNVSELKNVQIELEASKQRLQAIVDNISNGILTLDRQGNIESANPMSANIFRYPITELVGTSLQNLIAHPNNDTDWTDLVGPNGHEIVGRRYDGSEFPMYFAMSEVIFRTNGVKTQLYTCIVQDITERKRLEAELIEKEKISIALEKEREVRDLKNRFLSMMSHELRTPLASIQLSYDMLKQYSDRATEEEKQQYLDNIHVQTEYLADMVRDVMTLSKSDVDKQNFSPQPTDIITYVRNIIEEFQLLHHKTHHIDFRCKEKHVEAAIDHKLMRRALTNLIGNAIKYTPEQGKVDITLGTKADMMNISVKDSGIGIPEEDQKRLFEPFHRATNVDKRPGTGLGLAITKQAVEMHRGIITFKSIEGSGTTFTIQLPILA